ncbi:hypothetical protein ACWC2M_20085 [Streptomyces sp. NPDC001761]
MATRAPSTTPTARRPLHRRRRPRPAAPRGPARLRHLRRPAPHRPLPRRGEDGGGTAVRDQADGSDVRLGGDCFGAVRVDTGTVAGPVLRTWGTGVWTKAQPSVRAARVYAFPGPTTVRVACQEHAEPVTAEGYTNDAWSCLSDYRAWITNIYIQGPAWLDGVPTCSG